MGVSLICGMFAFFIFGGEKGGGGGGGGGSGRVVRHM